MTERRVAMRFENVSKHYTIDQTRYAAAHADLGGRVLSAIARPFRRGGDSGTSREVVWALRDISFEVGQGEVVGIVGPNGSGKSTLLKLLSRVTEPSAGRISLCGRLTSLLEVGTGFHPELTGRENVFLNGAILGMSRPEIAQRFDRIVEFSGIERFLDTPVKRYSSGMYVRLAFAIAAHLDHELMVVDEVLAVGDLAFRERCLATIEAAARDEGRTVLFVSHDMSQLTRLTKRAILIRDGSLVMDGRTADVVAAHANHFHQQSLERGEHRLLISAANTPGAPRLEVESGAPMTIVIACPPSTPDGHLTLAVHEGEQRLTAMSTPYRASVERVALSLDVIPLRAGTYRLEAVLRTSDATPIMGSGALTVTPPGEAQRVIAGDGLLALSGTWEQQ